MVNSKKKLAELAIIEMERMTINERRKYLYRMWKRYCEANRKEKGRLLDEMQAVTRMHRKSLIRILTGWLLRKKRSCERGRRYGAAVLAIRDGFENILSRLPFPVRELHPIRICCVSGKTKSTC